MSCVDDEKLNATDAHPELVNIHILVSCTRARDLSRSRQAIRRQLPTKNGKLTDFNQISPSMLQWTTLRMSPCVPRYLRSWHLPWAALCDLLHRTEICSYSNEVHMNRSPLHLLVKSKATLTHRKSRHEVLP